VAVCLPKAFGSGPEFRLCLPMNYDLAQVRRREAKSDLKRFKKAA
jgi:plasmid maintenance system antidote protein VapI